MATTAVALTSDWTAVTSAGESGSIWVHLEPGRGFILLDHSDSGAGTLDNEKSYFLPKNRKHITEISADNASDIYYAKCAVSGETATLVVDVV